MNNNTILQIENLKKEYSKGTLNFLMLDNLSFKITENSFTAVLSPRHSKKSLLFKIIAGLEQPTSGIVKAPNIITSYIPSEPSSFPWLNVLENVKLGLINKKNKEKSDVSEAIDLAGLQGYEEHFPNNKSLGFRFRIVLARALASGPDLIIIDEPFFQMDHTARIELYTLLREVYSQTGISFLLATSNISEAVFLSERILILDSETSGIINETFITMPEPRNEKLLKDKRFKDKVEEIETIVKRGETTLFFNSYLI